MSILVTGGAGNIGSHTCTPLTHQGHTVITYDNLSMGQRELVHWGDFVYGDIFGMQRLCSCIRQYCIEKITHCVDSAFAGKSVIDPGKYLCNDAYETLGIFDAMRNDGVPCIAASGRCANFESPNTISITEDTSNNSAPPYGASKPFMERMLADYEVTHVIQRMSVRCFNAKGCDVDGDTGEWHEPEPQLIPRALMAAADHIPDPKIFGNDAHTPDGICILNYVHFANLADAHTESVDNLKRKLLSQNLNPHTYHAISTKKIAQIAENVTELQISTFITDRNMDYSEILLKKRSHSKHLLQ